MTDKERFEELAYNVGISLDGEKALTEVVSWLINRVEELELEVNDWRDEVQKWQQFYEESEESHLETKELLESIVNQNKRYREAIERALGESSWGDEGNALNKIIGILNKALEGEND